MVVAGDRGLCGAFNTNVNRATAHLLAAHPEWTEVRLLPVGKKAVEFWKRRKYPFTEKTYPGIFDDAQVRARAGDRRASLAQEFLAERIDAAYIVVNEFRSILSQVVHDRGSSCRSRRRPPPKPRRRRAGGVDYLYEPDAQTILAWLLPRYLEFTVYRALAESAAAEMGARMTAMDSASKNAGEMIDKLTLTYNRARQARITKELIEIVSGAAALE